MIGLLIVGLISIIGITYFTVDELKGKIAEKLIAAIIADCMFISAIFAIVYIIKLAIKIM